MKPVILHVEDNPELSDLVEVAFNNLGFEGEIIRAGTVYEALEIVRDRLAQNHPIDLILADMHLPDGKGLEVIRKVKLNPAWRSIPVLVLSGDTSDHLVAEAYALGANCYLPKSFDDPAFSEVLESLYAQWFQAARLPLRTPPDAVREILGRIVGFKARVSQLYTGFSRALSGNIAHSTFWLDMAMNESNHANLFGFLWHSEGEFVVPADYMDQLSRHAVLRDDTLGIVERMVVSQPKKTMDDALRSALVLEATFSPELWAMGLGFLFSNAAAATVALKQSTANHLKALASTVLAESKDADLRASAEVLLHRAEVLCQTACPSVVPGG